MIGQTKLLKSITESINNDTFKQFTILCGDVGSGKKLLAFEISKLLNTEYCYMLPDIKVETVRKMINDAYKLSSKTLYIIPDADEMSVNAKNALLKIVEEPPVNAYFIMTLQDRNNALATILSRARVYTMDLYTEDEIFNYFWTIYPDGNPNDAEKCRAICDTPGSVKLVQKEGAFNLFDYTERVFDNIFDVDLSNAFKTAQKLNIKNDEGFDLKLFWNCFCALCAWQGKHDALRKTERSLERLRIGVNKQQLYDMWILDIRGE